MRRRVRTTLPAGLQRRTGVIATAGMVSLLLAACVAPSVDEGAAASSATIRASGNEPGWQAELRPGALTLALHGASALATYDSPAESRIEGGVQYVAGKRDAAVTMRVFDRLCADSMSGMPHPFTVEVVRSGNAPVLRGCGGEPVALLRQAEWRVRSINGHDVPDGALGTIRFGGDGRVAGTSFCNRYSGAYQLTGEGLAISGVASTMMACVGPGMELEGGFMVVLRQLARFEMPNASELILHAADGGQVRAALTPPDSNR